jgi:hypothetical protein
MFLQYNPDACQGRAPGEIPVVANDNGSPGTYSYWYRNLSEVNALITAQNCIGDNAAGTACGEAMVTSLQPIIDAHYSAYIANCQGFNPGAPHAPAP